MDTTATVTIPGWVWLLIVAALFVVIAIFMVRRIGWRNLFVLGEQRGANEWLRMMVFSMVIGVPFVCIEATVTHLWH